jgi:hypothetical protein
VLYFLFFQTLGSDGKELSEWEKFALDEYNILVNEDGNEGNANEGEEEIYEDDFEVKLERYFKGPTKAPLPPQPHPQWKLIVFPLFLHISNHLGRAPHSNAILFRLPRFILCEVILST